MEVIVNKTKFRQVSLFAAALALICFSLLASGELSPTGGAFEFSAEWKSRQALIPVALGQEPADLVIRGGQVFIAQTGEFKKGWVIATKGRRIAYLGPEDEAPKVVKMSVSIWRLTAPTTTRTSDSTAKSFSRPREPQRATGKKAAASANPSNHSQAKRELGRMLWARTQAKTNPEARQ
jgi:hypothetical protein